MLSGNEYHNGDDFTGRMLESENSHMGKKF